MNCPHCTQPIADALVASAAASISAAKRKRPSGPAGTPTACPKCHEVFGSVRALRKHRCPIRRKRTSPL